MMKPKNEVVLNMRLPSALLESAHEQAQERGTSLAKLIRKRIAPMTIGLFYQQPDGPGWLHLPVTSQQLSEKQVAPEIGSRVVLDPADSALLPDGQAPVGMRVSKRVFGHLSWDIAILCEGPPAVG